MEIRHSSDVNSSESVANSSRFVEDLPQTVSVNLNGDTGQAFDTLGKGDASTSFFMPFPTTAASPWLAETRTLMWDWIDELGLAPAPAARQHVSRTNPELLAARWYPSAARGYLPLLAEFCAWGFIVDDEFDEGALGHSAVLAGQAVGELCTVLDNGSVAAASPLGAALGDLWKRATLGRSQGWCRQFAANIKGWLVTYHRTALERETDFLPGVEEFREYRQFAVAMHMFMDLAEPVMGIDLPDRVRYASAILDMRRATAEHVALFNDIVSARKERGHGFDYNLVLAIERITQCGTVDAIHRANSIVTGVVHNFLDARRRMPAELSAAGCDRETITRAQTYADALVRLIRGDLDWHLETQRYTHPEELGVGLPEYVPDLFGLRTSGPAHTRARRAT